jgi:hypothetical protein
LNIGRYIEITMKAHDASDDQDHRRLQDRRHRLYRRVDLVLVEAATFDSIVSIAPVSSPTPITCVTIDGKTGLSFSGSAIVPPGLTDETIVETWRVITVRSRGRTRRTRSMFALLRPRLVGDVEDDQAAP